MRKFTKIVLISALVLVIIGGILLGAGIAFGATEESFAADMQANRFVQNWMYRIDAWDEHDDWDDDNRDDYDGWNGHDDMDDYDNKNHYNIYGNGIEKTDDGAVIAADKVEVLNLEVLAGETEIKVVSGNEIRISGLHRFDEVNYEEDERELDISREMNHQNADRKMVIEIPQDKVFLEMDLSVSAGELKTAGKLSAKECSITMTAGNLEAELLDSQKTDIECSAGSVTVKHTGKLDDYCVDVEDNMGNMTLDGKHHTGFQEGTFGNTESLRTIDVECNAGNVEIEFENQ